MDIVCANIQAHCNLCPAIHEYASEESNIYWWESGAYLEDPFVDADEFVEEVYGHMVGEVLMNLDLAAEMSTAYRSTYICPLVYEFKAVINDALDDIPF